MPDDDKPRFDLGLHQDREALWGRVRQALREAGEDPDEVLRQAGENLARLRAAREAMSEEARCAADEADARAWAEHEATLDDAGNPLKKKP